MVPGNKKWKAFSLVAFILFFCSWHVYSQKTIKVQGTKNAGEIERTDRVVPEAFEYPGTTYPIPTC